MTVNQVMKGQEILEVANQLRRVRADINGNRWKDLEYSMNCLSTDLFIQLKQDILKVIDDNIQWQEEKLSSL